MKQLPQLSPSEIGEISDFYILDVREQHEWDFVHLEAAHHLPLNQIATRYRELPSDRHILCMCHHGMRSLRAAKFLAGKGFTVSNLHGGIERWAIEKDSSLPRY